MSLPQPLPEIPESQATGETAALYRDIRETLGVGVVNLIWRHFATVDGGLAWAWSSLRPLYASGEVAATAAAVLQAPVLPALPPIPDSVLAACGVAAEERETLLAILATYNRGNALNICALAALDPSPMSRAVAAPSGPAALPRIHRPVPPLMPLEAFPMDVSQLVLELNRLGAVPDDPAIATLYRHLAPWPGFLALCWGLLCPRHADGSLRTAIDRCAHDARARSNALQMHATPAPEAVTSPVRAAARHFVNHVIARMIPIGTLLAAALAPPPALQSGHDGL